jgi:hypothetical protein
METLKMNTKLQNEFDRLESIINQKNYRGARAMIKQRSNQCRIQNALTKLNRMLRLPNMSKLAGEFY